MVVVAVVMVVVIRKGAGCLTDRMHDRQVLSNGSSCSGSSGCGSSGCANGNGDQKRYRMCE